MMNRVSALEKGEQFAKHQLKCQMDIFSYI
jgi:hypothetical protein